jgi:uncharacterized protein with HEPN domain
MVNDPPAPLFDVHRAIDAIELFVAGKSREDFTNDMKMRPAVERQFGIIGNAPTRLGRAHIDTANRIFAFHGFISFGDSLLTNYDSTDNEVTWRMVSDKLPTLRREINELLTSTLSE